MVYPSGPDEANGARTQLFCGADFFTLLTTVRAGRIAYKSVRSYRPTSPFLRSMAAMTLVCWVASLIFCTELCAETGSPADSVNTHSHGDAADSHHDHHDSSEPGKGSPCGPESCQPLKQALTASHRMAFDPPVELIFTVDDSRLTFQESETAFSQILRQAPPRDWVFTPEVCLGPAFHSLAPPAVS